MDTALITGMLETSFLPARQVEMDVQNEHTQNFSKILETTLKNNDVAKPEKMDSTNSRDVSNEQVDNDSEIDEANVQKEENGVDSSDETLTDVKDSEGKSKKRDKKEKVDENLNFVSQNELTKLIKKDNLLEEDVENKVGSITEDVSLENTEVIKLIGSIDNNGKMEIAPEEKLNELLNKLDVKLNQNVNIKDESEQVIKVGPQSVETEKIKLNIKDVEKYIEVEQKNRQGDIIASNHEEINIPTIQNPFKLKRLSDEKEINGLSQEINPETEDVLNNGEILGNDLIKEFRKLKDVEENSKDVKENSTDVFNENDVNDKDVYGQLSQESFNNEEETSKDGLNNKDDKIKLKDFRNKKDVDFKQEVLTKEDVEIKNDVEIKEINDIKKFENFVEQDILDQVTEKLEVSLFDNKSEMVIKLNPNDLGKVTVKITIENGVMNAKFLADSIKVKETLESNLNNLKDTLKEQGLSVQDLSVSVDSGRSQNNQTFEQNRLIYLNNKRDFSVNDNTVSYEDTYYEFSDTNTNNTRGYLMDSTVSFLA